MTNTSFSRLTKVLTRGSVISVVDTERPVIETFADGEKLVPFAFLAGVPIPYNIFMLFMALRFAPNRSQAMMEDRYDGGEFFLPPDDHQNLTTLWSLCELPQPIKDEIGHAMKPWTANRLIRRLVDELYTKHMEGDDESAKASFQTLIRRIDEDYTSSLIDPVKI